MEVSSASMNALIIMYLFSTVWGRFEDNRAVSPMSPRRAFIRKPFRNANSHEMHFRGMADNPFQYPPHHTMDPNVDLLARSNNHVIHTLQRIEAKFDHILNTVDFVESVNMRDIRDMTRKLNLIHQYISGPSEKDFNSPSENEMFPNRELVAAVRYSNENIRKLASKFDQVIENGRRSMQSIDKVAEIVENIYELTTRILHLSTRQSQDGTQNFSEDETIGCENLETQKSKQNGKVGHNRKNSAITNKRITYESNDFDIVEGNKEKIDASTTTNHHRQHLATMNDAFNENESNTYNNVATTTSRSDYEMYEENTADPPADATLNRANRFGTTDRVVETTTTSNNYLNENESVGRKVGAIKTSNNKMSEKGNAEYDYSAPPATATQNRALSGIGKTSHAAITTTNSNRFYEKESRDEHETTSTNEMNEHDTVDKSAPPEIATPNHVLNGIVTSSHAAVTTSSNNQFNENEGDGFQEYETTSTSETNGIVTTSHAAATTTSNNQLNDNESGGVDERETTSNEHVTADNSAPKTTANHGSIERNNVGQNASPTTKLLFSHKPKTEHKRIPKAKYRDVRKVSDGVTFEPNKRKCQDLSLKMNGLFKFGSQDEVANDAGRFLNEQYCDFNTNDKAWTVIQRRFAPLKDNFNMTWTDYKLGFGNLDHGFWFGNEFIHKLTSDYDMELRIVLEDAKGPIDWIEYSQFKVESEKDNYKLVVDGHRGTFEDIFHPHNNQGFSTYDRSNNEGTSCASSTGMGWWFKDCIGNTWTDWKGRTKILIRPNAFSEHKKPHKKVPQKDREDGR